MSTLISPITRRRIAAFSLALFPTAAWMAAATWGSHMQWRDWNTQTFRHFVMLTPQYPLLYGAVGVGLILSLVLILFIGPLRHNRCPLVFRSYLRERSE